MDADGGLTNTPGSSGAARRTMDLDHTVDEPPDARRPGPAGFRNMTASMGHVQGEEPACGAAGSQGSGASGATLALLESGVTPPPEEEPPVRSRPSDLQEWADRRKSRRTPCRPSEISATGKMGTFGPYEPPAGGVQKIDGPLGGPDAVGQPGPVPRANTAGTGGRGDTLRAQGPRTISEAFHAVSDSLNAARGAPKGGSDAIRAEPRPGSGDAPGEA